MASSIDPRSSFLYRSNECEKKQSSNPSEIDKKASVVADQALSNATWYVELPFAPNGKPSIITKLPPNMANVITAALETPQTKQKPTPPLRPNTTCLSPSAQRKASGTDGQRKAFPPDLLAVINARSSLTSEKKIPLLPPPQKNEPTISSMTSPTPRKRTLFPTKEASPQTVVDINIPKSLTPPAPPPQKNKPKFQPVSVAVPTLLSEKKVSFQAGAVTEDLGINSSGNSNTSTKSILKKTPPLSNTEKNTNTGPKTEVLDGWDDVDKIFNECFKYLND